jgi:hypothetical protein
VAELHPKNLGIFGLGSENGGALPNRRYAIWPGKESRALPRRCYVCCKARADFCAPRASPTISKSALAFSKCARACARSPMLR